MTYDRRRRTHLNNNHLRRLLCEPTRQEAESAFAREHADWSDGELLEWAAERKRRLGKSMKPATTVGFLYLTERLGDWSALMGKVNRMLEEERQEKAADGSTDREGE